MHNAKLPKSFSRARWKKGYNPDLIFAAENNENMCEKSIMDPILYIEYRAICVSVKPAVVSQENPFRRRFNMR